MGAVQPLVTLVRSQNRITQFELKHLIEPYYNMNLRSDIIIQKYSFISSKKGLINSSSHLLIRN